jgi:hypothetical protein
VKRFSVPEVWRAIIKKNERQGLHLFDVLACKHSVPANDNTYRRVRSCVECRLKVQEYAEKLEVSKPVQPTASPRQRIATPVRKLAVSGKRP